MHDISGLMKWTDRAEWEEAIEAKAALHLAALNEYEIDFEGLVERIGEDAVRAIEFFSFEDFLCSDADEGTNPIEDYLARRGWKEPATTRGYLEALRGSTPGAYEVSDIVPGKSFLARDLIRGGEPLRVEEKTGTTMMREWDVIGARLMTIRGRTIMGGAALRYNRETADRLIMELNRLLEAVRDSHRQLAVERGIDLPEAAVEALYTMDMMLRSAAFMFSVVWVRDALDRTEPENRPVLQTFEGDRLEPIVLQFGFASKVTQVRIRAVLDGVPALQPEGRNYWNWVDPAGSAGARHADAGLSFETRLAGGGLVIGNVELSGRDVLLRVLSRPRAERLGALLSGLLGELVKPPVEIEVDDEADDGKMLDLDDPEMASVLNEMIESHYRRVLDEPLPMLGNQTPRQAARTEKSRAQVVEWLKHIENNPATRQYDFKWMWQELGVADLRR